MKFKLYNKALLFLLPLLTTASSVHAQVTGLSYTLQPSASYTFWDNMAGLDDGLLYGGRVGLGFGENVELRGLYMLGTMDNNFEDFGLESIDGLATRSVDITRYGGEIKLNLSRGKLLPYLTLGAGIQELDLDGGQANESIYAAAGLGITLSIFDRITLNLEGRNTSFNNNSIRNLMTEADRGALGVDFKDFENERLSNWSIGAGLNFYLGGRRPGTLSAVDKAYQETFGNGFRNVSLLVEPTLTRVNWDDALPYENTFLGGASLGLDFGPLVGARVFYYRAMEDNEINFSFDDLSMYGADFRFRFSSVTTGLSPFLTVGGGYIDVQDDYINRNGELGAPSQGFASGGGGISLNITRNFRLTGTYRALLTTSSEVENIADTEQIRTSGQWSAGINLAFGKKAARPEAVFTSTANAQLTAQRTADQIKMQAALADQARKNAEATNQLKADYEVRLDKLRGDLAAAEAANDTLLIAELEEQVEETEEVVDELADRTEEYQDAALKAQSDSIALQGEAAIANAAAVEAPQQQVPAAPIAGIPGRISLTPAELEGLIEEIFEGINDGMQMIPPPPGMMMNGQQMMMAPNGQFMQAGPMVDTARINTMEQEIADLRTAMAEMAELQMEQQEARVADKQELRSEMTQSTEAILKEIRDMRADIKTELDNKSNMSDKERKRMDKDAADAADKATKAKEKAEKEAMEAAEKAAKQQAKEDKRKKKKDGKE